MLRTREGTSYSALWYMVEANVLYVKQLDGVLKPIRYDVELIN